MTLLGYLVPRIAASGVEPAATQALAYLLNAQTDISKAFIEFVRRTDIASFKLGRIAAEEQHGGCRPDLTITADDGYPRIFVENKFWAGLMEGQPVAYLEALPDELSSLLIFIVPHNRMYGLWNELKEKCRESKFNLTDEDTAGAIYWAKARPRTIGITSWKHVLETLEQALDAERHADLLCDIVQLRGLTDQMDADEFLPLREGEVNDLNTARRMINYIGLIDEIVGRLKTDGVALLAQGVAYEYAGRYLELHKQFETWLGVHLRVWRDLGITPLWIEIKRPAVEGGIERVKELFNDAHWREPWLCIPIRLTAKVDRDRVIEDAVRQVRSIAERLREEFPDG